jgi:hypothetical protein
MNDRDKIVVLDELRRSYLMMITLTYSSNIIAITIILLTKTVTLCNANYCTTPQTPQTPHVTHSLSLSVAHC